MHLREPLSGDISLISVKAFLLPPPLLFRYGPTHLWLAWCPLCLSDWLLTPNSSPVLAFSVLWWQTCAIHMASVQFSLEWTESVQRALPMCELCSDAWANATYKLIFGSLKIRVFFFTCFLCLLFSKLIKFYVHSPIQWKGRAVKWPSGGLCAQRLVFVIIIWDAIFGTYSLQHPNHVLCDLTVFPPVCSIKKANTGVRAMREWLGALATFPEDGCLISNTHMGLTTDYNSTPRGSDALFWQIYMQTKYPWRIKKKGQ